MLNNNDFIELATSGGRVSGEVFFITKDIDINDYDCNMRDCTFLFASNSSIRLKEREGGGKLRAATLIDIDRTESFELNKALRHLVKADADNVVRHKTPGEIQPPRSLTQDLRAMLRIYTSTSDGNLTTTSKEQAIQEIYIVSYMKVLSGNRVSHGHETIADYTNGTVEEYKTLDNRLVTQISEASNCDITNITITGLTKVYSSNVND